MEPRVKEILYDYIMSLVGIPYRFGGSNPISGYDCSGLCIDLLQACGRLPYGFDTTAGGLYAHFNNTSGVLTTTADFGTLAFYGKGLPLISHVAFCLSDKLMVESGGGDSTVKDKDSAALKNAFVKIRPIKYRKDFICLVKPNY